MMTNHPRKNIKPASTTLLIFITFCFVVTSQAANSEYQIKAIFLYNFLNYITWPPPTQTATQKTSNLCLFGGNPFGQSLSLIQKKAAPELIINIKVLTRNEITQIPSCHILFVTDMEQYSVTELYEILNQYGVLTVSDIADFATSVGIIELTKKNQKIKLIINKNRLKKVGLKARSQLLKIAKIVDGKEY